MWHARPLMDRDVEMVVALLDGCHDAHGGSPAPTTAALRAELAGVDAERDAVAVVQRGRVVAWGLVTDHGRTCRADVAPDASGQGIGSWLLKWSVWRAQSHGAPCVGQTLDDTRTGLIGWLETLGYTPRYGAWLLSGPAGPALDGAGPGITLDPAAPGGGGLHVVRREGRPVGAAQLLGDGSAVVDAEAVRQVVAGAAQVTRGGDAAQPPTPAQAQEAFGALGLTVRRSFTHWAVDVARRPR